MDILNTIILSIVQGLTEFLPVSSSGHLVLLHDFLDSEIINSLAFDAALHLGTLISLIIYFNKEISKYFKAFIASLNNFNVKKDDDQRLAWLLLLSTIPAIIVGLIYGDVIETVLRSPELVVVMLILVSILFIIVEIVSKQKKKLKDVNFFTMVLIACAQSLALIPGVSRSGITITTGMFANLDRESATRFSFLMSIPIVFMAGSKKVYDAIFMGLNSNQIFLYLLGVLVSAVIGYITIKYFLAFVKRFSLVWFAAYRVILALVVILLIL